MADQVLRTIKLYDQEHPETPRTELALNFDPQIHTRWENRPQALPAAPPGLDLPLERQELDGARQRRRGAPSEE